MEWGTIANVYGRPEEALGATHQLAILYRDLGRLEDAAPLFDTLLAESQGRGNVEQCIF